jgi:Holliday junction resolvase RusA-like endonuclease
MTGLTCAFTILGEPVPCGRPRSVPYIVWEGKTPKARVKVHPDPKSDAYEQAVGLVARTARPVGWRADWAVYELRARVFQARRAGDGDNFAKAIADGCAGILWENDRRIRLWHIQILDDLTRPRLEVLAVMLGEVDASEDAKLRSRALAKRRGRAASGSITGG